MRSVKILVFLIIIIFLSTDMSYARGFISGVVLDAETKQPVVGVSVSLGDGYKETIVDFMGCFKIDNLPKKYISITFMSYEYKMLIIDSVLIKPYENNEIDTFYLEREMDGIEVIEKSPHPLSKHLTEDEILKQRIINESDSNTSKDTVCLNKVIEVVGKRESLIHSRIPNITIVYVLVLNSKDSTELTGINLSLSDGTRATTSDSGMYLFYVDRREKNPIKFSHNGYKLTDELDFSKRIDTFYIPYPMLIEDTVFSFSGFALLKKDSLPVSNAIMTLWGIGTWDSKTNLEGFFNFDNLPPGNYRLSWSYKTSIIQWDQGYIDNITIDSTNIIDTCYLNEIRGQ